MKKILLTVVAFGALAWPLTGQVAFTGSYAQSFNTLPNDSATTAQASTYTWTDNSTLAGWYAGGMAG